MANPEVKTGEKKPRTFLNVAELGKKIVLGGALLFAAIAALEAPVLVLPALAVAAGEGISLAVINKAKNRSSQEKTVFQAKPQAA